MSYLNYIYIFFNTKKAANKTYPLKYGERLEFRLDSFNGLTCFSKEWPDQRNTFRKTKVIHVVNSVPTLQPAQPGPFRSVSI
jgi:hypothetical protein